MPCCGQSSSYSTTPTPAPAGGPPAKPTLSYEVTLPDGTVVNRDENGRPLTDTVAFNMARANPGSGVQAIPYPD